MSSGIPCGGGGAGWRGAAGVCTTEGPGGTGLAGTVATETGALCRWLNSQSTPPTTSSSASSAAISRPFREPESVSVGAGRSQLGQTLAPSGTAAPQCEQYMEGYSTAIIATGHERVNAVRQRPRPTPA